MLAGSTNAEKAWNFLVNCGISKAGAAGVIGNIDAESGINPSNLQDTYQGKLGFSDTGYVAAIDVGAYTREMFTQDGAGYGLCQWTWHSRKAALYDFWKSSKYSSIGDLELQLEFLLKELSANYRSLLSLLKTTASVHEASDAFLTRFECPANMEAAKTTRRKMSQKYYDLFVTNSAQTGGDNSMGYITCTKGKKKQLSKHFTSLEFDCQGRGCCSQTIINEQLVKYVQMIREHFDRPITITSGYRCPTHNSRVGGATGSRHSKGDACDIVVQGITPREVAKYAESAGILGIGLYETAKDGHFVHIDTRNYKSFWYGQAESPRTTFGGTGSTSSNNTSGSTTNTSLSTILSYRSTGSAVKELQEKLNKLDGCNCGEPDGIYGNRTVLAVRSFQRNYGGGKLSVDGIAGYHTLKRLDEVLAESIDTDTSEYKATVTAYVLNMRAGAGTTYKIVGSLRKGTSVSIVEENGNWGKIKDKNAWICLDYVKK